MQPNPRDANSNMGSAASATLATSITGLILAGGRGSRMHNCDKGLQELGGKSLIAHVVSRLAPQVSTLVINANRHLDEYARFGFPVYSDATHTSNTESEANFENPFEGPLAGLEVGLTHCKTPYLLTVPCDSPFLPTNLAARLMAALQQQEADIAIACTGELTHPRAQPVFCLLKTTLLEQLQRHLARGGRKMDSWYGQLPVARAYFRDETEFKNINTLEDLQSCSAMKIMK